MKKINAFTILELVITMLISSIVLGIGYQAMKAFNSRFGDFIKRSNQLSEYRLFEKAIQLDTDRSSAITWDDGLLLFKLQEGIVAYDFRHQQIMRVSADGRSVFSIEGEVNNSHYLDENSDLIDGLAISIKLLKEGIIFRLNKYYTPVEVLVTKAYRNE